MSVLQGTYQSILGGVSQQVYTDRQTSQVSEQINMTSDTVRGLRKRPGSRLSLDVSSTDSTQWSLGNTGHLRFYTTNLGWGVTTFIVNTITGKLTSIVETETVQLVGQSDYLIATDPADIVFTTVGSTMYIGNCDVVPTLEYDEDRKNPGLYGYYFVLAGAYNKEFTLTISTSGGTAGAGGSNTQTYQTPASTTADAADWAIPEVIAEQLYNFFTPIIGVAPIGLKSVTRTGAYLFFEIEEGYGELTVTTPSGQTYAKASNKHIVDDTDDLPANLPSVADGFIITVGDDTFSKYFQWSADTGRWIECGVYGSPTGIAADSMPLAVDSTSDTNQHAFTAQTWPGREAGNDDNNATSAFLDGSGVGMTGIATFQGRLIIFSGPYISMGASTKTYRNYFYRTTVTEVLDSDRIEFTSTSFSGANFRYGVPFNSDLILASDQHQGVIPGRNQVITPNNATAVLTSTYQMDTSVSPQTGGRSLYFAYPRSNSSFSIKEMLPSGYTDLQYTSQDVTDHLPTYLEGACTYIVNSTTNNIVVFGSSTETDTLYINEYLWSGDNKVMSSWHKWTFDGTVHCAYFVREVLHVLLERDNTMELLTLSLRDSPDPSDQLRYLPATDFNLTMNVTNPTSNAPYIQFSATEPLQLQLWNAIVAQMAVDGDLSGTAVCVHTGDYLAAEVGIKSIDELNMRLNLQPGYGTATLMVGIRFTATFSPTPPRVLDQNGTYVDVDKLVVQCFNLALRYSSPFEVTASDRGGTVYDATPSYAIDYVSDELNLDSPMLDERYRMRIRLGLEAESSRVVFTSSTAADFNLQSLGYILKVINRHKRF